MNLEMVVAVLQGVLALLFAVQATPNIPIEVKEQALKAYESAELLAQVATEVSAPQLDELGNVLGTQAYQMIAPIPEIKTFGPTPTPRYEGVPRVDRKVIVTHPDGTKDFLGNAQMRYHGETLVLKLWNRCGFEKPKYVEAYDLCDRETPDPRFKLEPIANIVLTVEMTTRGETFDKTVTVFKESFTTDHEGKIFVTLPKTEKQAQVYIKEIRGSGERPIGSFAVSGN